MPVAVDSDVPSVAPHLRSVFEIIGLVLAPASLLTALLFYFGWTFTNARALYFGIDPSAFGYTTQDYLLRSVDPIFIPMGALLVVAVSIVSVHSVLVRRLADVRQPRLRTLVLAGLAAAGCAAFLAGLFGVVTGSLFGETFLVTPLALAFGLGAMAYSAQLSRRFAGERPPAPRPPAQGRSAATARVILVALFVVLNLFWAVRDWANAVGRGRAQELARMIPYRPSVVVYSKSELHIDAPGVEMTEVGGGDSAYRFRYQGLTMLVYSNDRYFLVATQSSPDNPRTIVLPDRDDLRLEFSSRLFD
ncbi:MAG: hypothetical protein ACR2KK_08985 [Acidimicrobiales bacterium]